MASRGPDLQRRLTRYLTIGGVAFGIDTALFALAHLQLGIPALVANVVSTVAATGFSFVANARLTFAVNDRLD